MFRLGWPELVIVTAIISVLLIWRLPQVERRLNEGLKTSRRIGSDGSERPAVRYWKRSLCC